MMSFIQAFIELSCFENLIILKSYTKLGEEGLIFSLNIKYKGPMDRRYNVILLHNGNHFDVITNPSLFFFGPKLNFCFECLEPFKSRINHKIKCPGFFLIYHKNKTNLAKCPSCCLVGRGNCPSINQPQECSSCFKIFYNDDCFLRHFGSACNTFMKCRKCGVNFRRKQSHVCNFSFCNSCHIYHEKDIPCFIQPLEFKKDKPVRIVCFDLETTQDTVTKDGITQHLVNFVSAR